MSLQRDMENLRLAWQDFGYVLARETGLLRLVARLGWKEKPWVAEARARVEHLEGQ